VHTPLWQSPATTQVLPFAQSPQDGPPQSTSVSLPFFTVSLQPAPWQTFGVPLQTLLIQSPATLHVLPVPQSPHVPPPQSTSVSAPFLTTSEHVGAWQVTLQTPLEQSFGAPHVLPVPHRAQPGDGVGPPQSMSLSPWFFAPSAHVGVVQASDTHRVLVQSVPVVQALVGPQRLQLVAPPQSTSLSAWFFTVSVHDGAAQTLPVQTPLWQSPATRHALPAAQSPQRAPPQSTSVSPPFLTVSAHVGAWQTLPVQTPL
jgi:hypothetical protein